MNFKNWREHVIPVIWIGLMSVATIIIYYGIQPIQEFIYDAIIESLGLV